jgi:hypothetical protein
VPYVRVATDDLKNRRCSAHNLCCGKISINILSIAGLFFFLLICIKTKEDKEKSLYFADF